MRSRALRALAAVALLCASGGATVLAGALAGAEPDSVLRVESVDSRGDPWSMSGVATGGDPSVAVDGRKVDAQISRDPSTDVVLVVDNSQSLGNGTVQLAQEALATLAPGSESGVGRAAVVSTANVGAHQELGLSRDPASVTDALAGVQQSGDAATWDALARAGGLLEASDAEDRRVIAVLAAPDAASRNSAVTAQNALRRAGARLDVVVLPSGVDSASLSDSVSRLGGSLHSATSDDQLDDELASVAGALAGRFTASFAAPDGGGDTARITVRAGGQSETVEAVVGSLQTGVEALAVGSSDQGFVSRLMDSPLLHWLAVLVFAAAVGGGVWALLSLVVPDQDSLTRRLKAYEESGVEEDEDIGPVESVTTVPILQRAVAITGQVAERRGLLDNVETTLERANLPLRAAEAMFFVAVASVLCGVLALAVTRNPIMALVAAAVAVMVPKALLSARVRSRQKKFVAQLPDMLSLLAGTLKAGYSITQGFEAVSKEIEDPMGRELRRVVTEHRLGRTLEDALDATSERMGSDDFAWTVMAIKIQREVGGNLAELLLTVADTMTQRERLRRDVASLTAEGRISAMILGLLPPGLGVVMYMMNRDYIVQLFTPGLGYVMLGAAGIAMAIGFAWMKKIITIEV